MEKPSTHAYFYPLRGVVVSSLLIKKKKTKEAPNLKVKILCSLICCPNFYYPSLILQLGYDVVSRPKLLGSSMLLDP
jgi:hypothetical protein